MTQSDSIVDGVRKGGVVGPGLMGLGIAQIMASAGIEVALCGKSPEASERGYKNLVSSVDRQIKRGRLDEGVARRILVNVHPAMLSPEDLSGCEIVIESVPEVRQLKMQVLARMESAAPKALLATNTSGLPIDGLSNALADPSRFLGLHFFSPAERMLLVEVVCGPRTSLQSAETALKFLKSAGKRPVRVSDGPGFFTSRVFAAYLDEAVAMMTEGIAVEAIEEAAIANGRALGPLAMLDETGIALNLAQAQQAEADGLEMRFCRPLSKTVLSRLMAAGRKGRRAGGGFFDWFPEGVRTEWAVLRSEFPRAEHQPQLAKVQLRLLAAEAREALRCLEEEVIKSADDADVASTLGLGFPGKIGGVLRWAEDYGLIPLSEIFDRLAAVHGERFATSPWLRDLARRGEGLASFRNREVVA
jgi:3-hydroxyacyl-CoA dehydrogenase